jgi:hypothetical protein
LAQEQERARISFLDAMYFYNFGFFSEPDEENPFKYLKENVLSGKYNELSYDNQGKSWVHMLNDFKKPKKFIKHKSFINMLDFLKSEQKRNNFS